MEVASILAVRACMPKVAVFIGSQAITHAECDQAGLLKRSR